MPIMKYKDPNTGKWVPVRTYAVEGDGVNTASSIRTEVTVEAEPWSGQPSLVIDSAHDGSLPSDFVTFDQAAERGDANPWLSSVYFVTLKDADGNALDSGYFKLCTEIDGYAAAIDQIFCLPSLDNGMEIIYENMPVNFYSISDDRTSFAMRDAGVTNVKFNCKNPLAQKYTVLCNGGTVCTQTSGGKYFTIYDSISDDYGTKIANFVWVNPTYHGGNGILNYLGSAISTATNSTTGEKCSVARLGVKWTYERTKNGAVGIYNVLINKITGSGQGTYRSDAWFADTTKVTDDLTIESIKHFRVRAHGDNYYFLNGTSLVLIEEQ